MTDVLIIGSKGIPAKYGGFETFVDNLVENKLSDEIRYNVSCLSNNNNVFSYRGARCFNVKVWNIGSAKAVIYDILALKACIKYIKQNGLEGAIIYILACRIGPFLWFYKKKLKRNRIKIFINPDGQEWKRSKWNRLIRAYWKFSEKLMVKTGDLLICDSVGIQDYVKTEYKKFEPETIYIAYGADINRSVLSDGAEDLTSWYSKNNITKNNYFLVIGRFVPENNYEIIIKEFMKSNTKKDLILITNAEQCRFYNKLNKTTNFYIDKRIKFVGTVYDKELLKKIREDAYAYIHGHEVGGTNPSLLEALASTKINLLLDVVFNREVGKNGAVYFTKETSNLANLIDNVDNYGADEILKLGVRARDKIIKNYHWSKIISQYEDLFLDKLYK